ncbi:MAG: NAD(+) diphosphatase [Deltaproteobacteria bacterium]|nr:NAD(+) diphosphatase [Deltaproteobacteria bacterium]
MSFIPGFEPLSEPSGPALWFIFNEQKLLIVNRDGHEDLPQTSDLKTPSLMTMYQQYIGSLNGKPCYAAEVNGTDPIPAAFVFRGIRSLFGRFEDEAVLVAGLANQLIVWNRNHRYCGKCGHPTENKKDERARVCLDCGLVNYPRLSPAVIMAVLKGEQILLARSQRMPAKFYSVLAGFVEPGETLEQCVQREVREETGIEVDHIRYFGSQPWPFPDSLMVAFIADYAGGTITIDGSEILDAGWFSAGSLPAIPPKISIARRLIDWFMETKG